MQLLFLDDSFHKQSWHLGYGGFAIEASSLKPLAEEVALLKADVGLPPSAEIKWSPPPGHPLRTKLKGTRHDLYQRAIAILHRHGARALCAVHALRECYGVAHHKWTRDRAVRWAAHQQLRFLAERFAAPLLSTVDDEGLVICDHYSSRTDDVKATESFRHDLAQGTDYATLERIPHVMLMADSKHSPAIQLADVVVGVATSALAGNKYGGALFPHLAPILLSNPHTFAGSPSTSILGYGFKVFPVSATGSARQLFSELDANHVITREGWRARSVRA